MARRLPVWERDVAEAASVAGRTTGHQFEIQLGHLCNERCVFCSSGQLSAMKLARAIPLGPIVEAIEGARVDGARRITFLGGEPTLHKGFPAALERAVALGFEEIVIFTNGVMLPHPGFVERIAALGNSAEPNAAPHSASPRLEWRISIQGGNEAAHVAVTKRADSFARIVTGLRLLRQHGQRVTVNVCVNELSYRSLPDYPALVAEHGITQLHVDIVRPESVGARPDGYLREIMPRYSDMAPHLAEMLERFEAWDPGFDVNVGNLPFCILPTWADRIHHGGEPTVTRAADPEGLEPEVDKYAWHRSQRAHVPACERCVMRGECSGVFREYLELYGDDELRPIGEAELRASRLGFVRFGLPALAPLFDGEPPPGLVRDGSETDTRGRRAHVSFRTTGGARITLVLEPRSTRSEDGWVVHTTELAQVRVRADADVHASELRRLLAWITQASGAPEAIDVDRTVETILAPHALARGRARIARLVDRVATRAFGPFRHRESREREDGAGTVVSFAAPDGRSFDVVFALGSAGGRSQVSIDVTLGEGTEPDAARASVGEVLRTLADAG